MPMSNCRWKRRSCRNAWGPSFYWLVNWLYLKWQEWSFIYRSFQWTAQWEARTLKPFPPGKRSSVDPLCPGSALLCGRSSWQLSSSQHERKWLSGAVLNSPSTGRKSGLNEAISRIGHAVRAHQSSHPLIRLQHFQHPFTGKKLSQGNWSELHLP